MPFFAYVDGLKGREPVKYRERQTNGHGMSADNITQIEISEAAFALPLRELALMFPAPEAHDARQTES